jgi:hypothetical protein
VNQTTEAPQAPLGCPSFTSAASLLDVVGPKSCEEERDRFLAMSACLILPAPYCLEIDK